jgi:hypothetical protein
MAQASTRLLRESDEPVWARFRVIFAERGIDPDRWALVAGFPDDTDMEFGVVVTPEHAVYEFDLRYGKGDLAKRAKAAFVSDWRNITNGWKSKPHRQDIEDALALRADA